MALCEFSNPFMFTTSIVERVSALLQEEWDTTFVDVAVSAIEWLTKREDAALWQGPVLGTKEVMIACYSPSPPMRVKTISNEWWDMEQGVTIDVALKVTSETSSAKRVILTKMIVELERIIHGNQRDVCGVRFMCLTGENTHVEGKTLLRATFGVVCQWFHLADEPCWFFTFTE